MLCNESLGQQYKGSCQTSAFRVNPVRYGVSAKVTLCRLSTNQQKALEPIPNDDEFLDLSQYSVLNVDNLPPKKVSGRTSDFPVLPIAQSIKGKALTVYKDKSQTIQDGNRLKKSLKGAEVSTRKKTVPYLEASSTIGKISSTDKVKISEPNKIIHPKSIRIISDNGTSLSLNRIDELNDAENLRNQTEPQRARESSRITKKSVPNSTHATIKDFGSGSLGSNSSSVSHETYPNISREEVKIREDFDALWWAYRRELKITVEVCARIAQEAHAGRLPRDADVLKKRVFDLLELGKRMPALHVRHLLNTRRATLRYEANFLEASARRLAALLPHYDLGFLVGSLVNELHRSLDVLALQWAEVDAAFMAGVATHAPPRVFSYLIGQDFKAPSSALSAYRVPLPAVTTRSAHIAAVMSAEVALLSLSRCPLLLGIEPSVFDTRSEGLKNLLGLSHLELARMLEARGSLLLLETSELEQRLDRLAQVLGWTRSDTVVLAKRCPVVLNQTSESITAKWQRILELSRLRTIWQKDLVRSRMAVAEAVMQHSEDVGARLEFLASTRSGTELGLKRVITESRSEFNLMFPRYRRWLIEVYKPPRRDDEPLNQEGEGAFESEF